MIDLHLEGELLLIQKTQAVFILFAADATGRIPFYVSSHSLLQNPSDSSLVTKRPAPVLVKSPLTKCFLSSQLDSTVTNTG